MLQLGHKKESFQKYISFLRTIAAISRLYSESSKPYIEYRIAENIFCHSFNAENLSRSDIAYDARLGRICFGIKTFVDGSPWQKIAEFNKESSSIHGLSAEKQIKRIALLRNERISFADRLLDSESAIYHCVIRDAGLIYLFEEPYSNIDIDNISIIKSRRSKIKTSVSFSDSKNDYRYNYSKSTLYKRFVRTKDAYKIPVTILDNPLELLEKLLRDDAALAAKAYEEDYVILPLYSTRGDKKEVQEFSALNQWNARGRKRDYGEVYIPVPMGIHHHFPGFFPARDKSWDLITPSEEKLSAKLCQENSKALMTNPNNALADWLLRDTLGLKEGELLTYEKLERVRVDSIRITKLAQGKYKISFAKLGSYEKFIKNAAKNRRGS